MLKKKPIQIYLDKKQDEILEYFAKKLGTSKAELIRRSVEDFLKKKIPVEKDPALEIIDLGGKGHIPSLSEKHDDYIVRFAKERKKKR